MDLRQLEYFRAVAQLRNMSQAAQKFHIAQPSVTVAIQKLEEELGVLLFDRRQRRITLTPEGGLFLKHADDILNRVQQSMAEMNECKAHDRGTIKFGITPIVGGSLFPEVFAKFRSCYPYFELIFIEEGTLAIRKKLERGELDIGLIITSNLSGHLRTLQMTKAEVVVCLSANHPLASSTDIAFDKLGNYPFIMFKEDTYIRKLILEECRKYNLIPQIPFSSRQIETILGLVEQGVGISFLPGKIACKHSRIIGRPLTNPLYIHAGLAWNDRLYLSAATKTFIDFTTQQFPFTE
jgi:DNA-binding transcriptional LysR family regulator